MTCPLCNDTGEQRYWEGRWRDEKADNERLRADLVATQRTLWLVIRSNGGYTVERHDLEGYPGDEMAVLSVNTDTTTGDKIFLAIVKDGDNQQTTHSDKP